MATTRLAMIERMADAMALRLAGTLPTAHSASSTSITDAAKRHEQDDFLNEGFFLATSSGGVVEEHRISDFTGATGKIDLYGSGLTTSLASALGYDVLLPPITPDHYRAAIKSAASKLAARGITRRAVDTQIATAGGRRTALTSTTDISVSEVYIQARELIPDHDWQGGGNGWTLDTVASLGNDGDAQERTLKHVNSPAPGTAGFSYVDVGVTGYGEFEFFANLKADGSHAVSWLYSFLDAAGTTIAALATAFSHTTATWAAYSSPIHVPVNAVTLRLLFYSPVANTGAWTAAPNLMFYGDWTRLDGWRIEYDNETGYLLLPPDLPLARRLKLVGRRNMDALTADTDTLALDEPEIAAFTELACSEAWRMFGSRFGMEAAAVSAQVAVHDMEYRKLVSSMSGPWRLTRRVRTPQFSSGH